MLLRKIIKVGPMLNNTALSDSPPGYIKIRAARLQAWIVGVENKKNVDFFRPDWLSARAILLDIEKTVPI